MTYDYVCAGELGCGHEWSEKAKITDPPTKSCPECKRETAKRLVGASAFVLKGNGWYRDGYA